MYEGSHWSAIDCFHRSPDLSLLQICSKPLNLSAIIVGSRRATGDCDISRLWSVIEGKSPAGSKSTLPSLYCSGRVGIDTGIQIKLKGRKIVDFVCESSLNHTRD
ncbi:unnamed protein product [Linum trigynum]|uniref:Uncharacterized protein n=1 Tax=Linum trigynum TaxID=586398 RepID=A0AAV2G421_9ROSI